MPARDLRHVVSDVPRVMAVDGSKLVRKLIGDVLLRELPNAQVIACDGLSSARAAPSPRPRWTWSPPRCCCPMAMVWRSRAACARPRESYVAVIVVSGTAQELLESRRSTEDVTDYFDKALGHSALAAFIRGYVHPAPVSGARVLYVEDSRVVAMATKRMLARQGLSVVHVISAEDALEYLHAQRDLPGAPGAELVLTDVYLKGALTGRELLSQIRGPFGYDKRHLPVLVMTGDANLDNQSQLLREGANDLVLKPIEERLLVTKTLFQLRLSRLPEQRILDA